MDWDYTISTLGADPIVLPIAFTSNVLAIDIQADNYRPTWFKSGYLKSFIDINGDSFSGISKVLNFGTQLIDFPYSTYQLQIQLVGWLVNPTLKIKQLSTQTIKSIMPLYTAIPATFGDQPVIDSLPTSFSAPQYLAATLPAAYQCLPANTARQGFAVTNTGTAPVFLDLDAPTAAGKRFVSIAINSTYVSDLVYQGAVFLWSSNAASQSCEIREFIQ